MTLPQSSTIWWKSRHLLELHLSVPSNAVFCKASGKVRTQFVFRWQDAFGYPSMLVKRKQKEEYRCICIFKFQVLVFCFLFFFLKRIIRKNTLFQFWFGGTSNVSVCLRHKRLLVVLQTDEILRVHEKYKPFSIFLHQLTITFLSCAEFG